MRRNALLFSILVLLTLAPQSSKAGRCVHVVERGETLSRIARAHRVSEKDLIAANPVLAKNPDRVRVGQELEICAAKRRPSRRRGPCGEGGRLIVHTVASGDNVGAIAAHYSVSRDSIRKHNGKLRTRRNDMIRVGETLDVCTKDRGASERRWLADGVPLPEGEGYDNRRPDNAWGTKLAVDGIVTALAAYVDREPDAPQVQVGDISRKTGGPLREHLSHQEGRDVDIGVVWTDAGGGQCRSLDVPRTWSLVRSFIETEGVRVIFIDYRLQQQLYEHALSIGEDEAWLDGVFQYPRKDGEGLLYHWPGH